MPLSVRVTKEIAGNVGPGAPEALKKDFLLNYGNVNPVNARVSALVYLMCDPNASIATDAADRFRRLPENVLQEAYDQGLEQPVVDFMVREHHSAQKLFGKIILRDGLRDYAFQYLVLHGSDGAIDTVRRRNMNFLNSEAVVEQLFENPKIRKGTLDRILAILGMDISVSLDDMPKKKAAAPVPPQPIPSQAQPKAGEIPKDDQPQYRAPTERRGPALLGEEDEDEGFDLEAFRSFFEDANFSFGDALMGESEKDLSDDEKESLFRQVIKMPAAQKIVLALKGNRDARNLLLRDGNKLIPLYVLQNNSITEEEVANIAMNRSASRELIAEITRSRDWTKSYKVRRELVMNPKTPLDKALSYLSVLGLRDIISISRSKNVPTSLSNQAKKMVKKKRETGTIGQ